MSKKSQLPDAKTIYFWNLLGNLAASGVSVLYLLIVTRLTSASLADQFSLVWSIGTLWVVIGLFQVRNYHGTDVRQKHSFRAYFQARILTILAMIVTLLPYLKIIGGNRYTSSVILMAFLMILYRAWDSVSDLFQGLFQQRERMDIAGKTMFYRYSTSTVVLFLALIVSKSLIASLLALTIWNGLFILLYEFRFVHHFESINWRGVFDLRKIHESLDILKECFPLFLNGFILLYVLNEPKLIIERGLSEGVLQTGMQRDFNILFMPVFFMSLIILMVRPLITQLAFLYVDKECDKFDSIIKKLLLYIIGGGLLVVCLAYLLGVQVLGLVFGLDLASYQLPFTILILAGVLYAVAIIFENILTIMRKQHLLIAIYVAMLIVTLLITKTFIYSWGMLGASLAFLVVMIVYVFGISIIYFRERIKERRQ
ncbi:polysaccharide biosynthesis protein [Streptococcus sp. HMSC078H03]|uniref:lipopolysaccharide biosynthesis protein n=1 Tax=unclassified Streptococcus TaxID=2608887 RepID=UPI0008A58A4C|nr:MULTISPECIES: polysaccharide biosynthesis protein [unclassified Streptococcus]MDU7738769.1 lipopolysaccharide biosynthesis protein [Streptococcus sp.]OFO00131.1 polysaccharide biosynthesis protein [Streptococcus sp. HMSC078H03]